MLPCRFTFNALPVPMLAPGFLHRIALVNIYFLYFSNMTFFPVSVSEGSFLNLGHHYLAFNYLAFVCSPFHFLLFLYCPSFRFWLFWGIGRAASLQKCQWLIWFGDHVFSKRQFLYLIMPARGLIQTEQFLIWFGEHMFSK